MQTFRDVQGIKKYLRLIQNEGLRIGLVPTMGALHDGHLTLVGHAKERADVVVASVFVNPTQFGPNEDYTRYPRALESDSKKLEGAGCDVVFAPEVSEIYPDGFQTDVEVTKVSKGLCGDKRPGHFKGVATIVLKLLNIVRPDVAVFGEKDFQQLSVIKTLVRDLALDTEIFGAPLIREKDGLAMSSRNAFLSPDDRQKALSISRGLFAAKAAYEKGERQGARLLALVEQELKGVSLSPEYLELRSFLTLIPLDRADDPAVILIALRVGSTRLIDNLILSRP